MFVDTHIYFFFFLRLPTTVLFSLLESSRCKDEEMSVQMVDRNRAEMRNGRRQLEFWTVCVLEGWVCVALEREEKKKVGARRC